MYPQAGNTVKETSEQTAKAISNTLPNTRGERREQWIINYSILSVYTSIIWRRLYIYAVSASPM